MTNALRTLALVLSLSFVGVTTGGCLVRTGPSHGHSRHHARKAPKHKHKHCHWKGKHKRKRKCHKHKHRHPHH